MKNTGRNLTVKNLRHKAEELLKRNNTKAADNYTEQEMLKLIHELEVHQIELEMLNEELTLAKAEAVSSSEKFTELYDFAPSGYFTLSTDGIILELNLSGSDMLGRERFYLTNRRFIFFVSDDAKPIFTDFLDKTLTTKAKQTCELNLIREGNLPIYVHLTGIMATNSEKCLVTAIDITERKQLENLNDILLSSLPYPAMYIRQKDRVVMSANKIALDMGVKIGGHCWRDFGKTDFISEQEKEIAKIYPNNVPSNFPIKCSFCLANECISNASQQRIPELQAFGSIWDTYWLKVSDDIFLHYAVNITEKKQAEIALQESEMFLKQTQQIAMLGTYTMDIASESWVSSEVLNSIFGIDANAIKTLELWESILHPEWQKKMMNYFWLEVIGNKAKFDKDYKIIRQNDNAERWVHGIGELVFDDENKPIKMIGTIQDITERKQAEEERKLLLAAVENSDNRIVVKDLNLKVIAANNAWVISRGETTIKNLLGKTDAEILGISPDSEPVRTYMEDDRRSQSLAQGEFLQSEIPMKLFNGKDSIAIVKRFPIFDEKGNLFCTGVVSTDITERKKTEEALRESEMFLKKTQQIAMLGTYSMDIITGNWSSSEVMDSIFGIDANFEKTLEGLTSIIHPEWQKTMTEYFLIEVVGNKTKFDKEYEIIRQNDKAERWVHEIGELKLNEFDQPIKMIGTIQDITDWKQAEEEKRFLLASVENTNDIVSVKDLELRVVAANKAFLDATGNSSIKNVIGKNDAEIFGISTDFEPIKTYMEDEKRAHHLNPGEYILREEPLILPNGQTRTILTKKYPIFDHAGRLFCTGNISTDITERKQSEEALWLKNIIFDASIAANSIAGLDFNITDANDAFLRNMGYLNKNDVIGKPISYFFEDENEAKFIAAALTNTGQWEGDFTVRRGDDSTFIAHAVATVVHDKNGNIIGFQSSIIDITDRKQAEDALRKSEQMLLSVLDHFPGVVFWKDRQSNYVGCNHAFATAAGLNNTTEIIGKTDFDLPWSKTEAVDYRIDDFEVMELGKTKLHIVETQHQKNNKVIWFDTSKVPICNSAGNVIGVIGVSIDITDRKLAEDALKESEEKYRTVSNYTNDWEFWIDQNEEYLYCSPSCERITGYNASEFMQNSRLRSDLIHPDDFEIFQLHKDKENQRQSANQEIQYRIIRLDGKIRWIGHVCQPIYNETGQFRGVRGSNRDITERKETEQLLITSEQKYKLLSENISDGIFICKNGEFEYVNLAMNEIFGYDDLELEGMKLIQLVKPEWTGDLENFLKLSSTVNQSLNIELKCIKKDQSIVYVEIFLNYAANEKVIYGVAHDITEKRQIQKKNIVKAIIQTEEQEKAYFAKELHDGLGPLLSTIKLYLQWSKRQKSVKTQEEIILKAEEILEEALISVKEISNKLSPHLLTNYGLTAAIQMFVNKLQETSAIEINFQSNANRRIDTEVEAALYRAIIECINNTIKHAKANKITISINDTGSHMLLRYIDDGIGFDVEKTFSEQKGLGLFNLKNRIQSIGGKIKMLSSQGHGVEYQLTVPI